MMRSRINMIRHRHQQNEEQREQQHKARHAYDCLLSSSSSSSSSSQIWFYTLMLIWIVFIINFDMIQSFTLVPNNNNNNYYITKHYHHRWHYNKQLQEYNTNNLILHSHHDNIIRSDFVKLRQIKTSNVVYYHNAHQSNRIHHVTNHHIVRRSSICLKSSSLQSDTVLLNDSSSSNIPIEDTNHNDIKKICKHILAILVMPHTSFDRIINESILDTVLSHISNDDSSKISIVLRNSDDMKPSVVQLRRYVGEIYSQLWDCCISSYSDTNNNNKNKFILPNVIVYPQNLPNTAPESWLDIQSDLDCICSYDPIIGWTSFTKNNIIRSQTNRIQKYVQSIGNGFGGLKEHVDAVNRERNMRKLKQVDTLLVEAINNPILSTNETNLQHVVFLDDDNDTDADNIRPNMNNYDDNDSSTFGLYQDNNNNNNNNNNKLLYNSVAVGGTFDGLHFGHRKLLTLAISSVQPITGRLLIGITIDSMLLNKQYSNYIPNYQIRCQGVLNFISSLCPGLMNQITIQPISDIYGPCGDILWDTKYKFDSLILSHETLVTGYQLNIYRIQNNMKPLTLLCTRRTETHGMSSTTLRKLRSNEEQNEQTEQEKQEI